MASRVECQLLAEWRPEPSAEPCYWSGECRPQPLAEWRVATPLRDQATQRRHCSGELGSGRGKVAVASGTRQDLIVLPSVQCLAVHCSVLKQCDAVKCKVELSFVKCTVACAVSS